MYYMFIYMLYPCHLYAVLQPQKYNNLMFDFIMPDVIREYIYQGETLGVLKILRKLRNTKYIHRFIWFFHSKCRRVCMRKE